MTLVKAGKLRQVKKFSSLNSQGKFFNVENIHYISISIKNYSRKGENHKNKLEVVKNNLTVSYVQRNIRLIFTGHKPAL